MMVDGTPTAPADFAELMVMMDRFTIATETVGVIADGSDGGAAIVRAIGPVSEIPFFAPLAAAFLTDELGDLMGALDWVLEPGAEHVELRLTIASARNYDTPIRIPLFFFFQDSRMPEWHPNGSGFDPGTDAIDYVAFADDDATSYAWANPAGPLTPSLSLSGASIFQPDIFVVDACAETELSYAELHVGGIGLDGLRAAIARTRGAALHEVTGTVTLDDGSPAPGVRVHATDASGGHVSRTLTDESGAFTLHLPPDDVELVAWKRGYPLSDPVSVGASDSTAALTMPSVGAIHVVATDAASGEALPVRVQVIPMGELPEVPPSFGETPIVPGRLHVEFPLDGDVTLVAPPGRHRVYVSRGFEWELASATVDVTAGATTEVPIALDHVVDTPGVLCGDFHIHTYRSFDTSDPVLFKVRSLVGDGLEIPVRSDHEWVGDFEPTIAMLGARDWAMGISSLELTTFDWGHFGVFPLAADPTRPSDGAIVWTGGRMPQSVFDEAHDRSGPDGSPAIIVNHARSFNGLMGEGAYFSRVDYDPATGMVGRPELWSESFDLIEAFNDSDFETNYAEGEVVRDWFSFLDSGRRIFATGSSDSHQVAETPVGYPRTCLALGVDDVPALRAGGGAGLVRDTLLAGHAVISGGAYIDVVGPGGEGPGDGIGESDRVTLSVTVRAPSFVEVDRLRVFVDGAVNETIVLDESTRDPMDPTVRFRGDIDIPVAPGVVGSWAIFVADGVSSDLGPVYPGRRPFGVTNPLFFTR